MSETPDGRPVRMRAEAAALRARTDPLRAEVQHRGEQLRAHVLAAEEA